MVLKTLLVDDEILNLKNLEILLLENFPEIVILAKYQNVVEAKKFIENNAIDLLFLDISMPIENGFDLLTYFPQRNFQVIFVTAHEEYALKAIKVGALDYILKPILISELREAIHKVISSYKTNDVKVLSKKLTLNYENGKSILDYDEIVYLKGFDNITTLYLSKKRKITVAKTLKYFEEVLETDFYRIHKSFIVNIKYIAKVMTKQTHFIELLEGTQLPVSRRNYKNLNAILKK